MTDCGPLTSEQSRHLLAELDVFADTLTSELHRGMAEAVETTDPGDFYSHDGSLLRSHSKLGAISRGEMEGMARGIDVLRLALSISNYRRPSTDSLDALSLVRRVVAELAEAATKIRPGDEPDRELKAANRLGVASGYSRIITGISEVVSETLMTFEPIDSMLPSEYFGRFQNLMADFGAGEHLEDPDPEDNSDEDTDKPFYLA